MDVPDADPGTVGDFAAGFVLWHGLHEFVSKESQLDLHRPVGRFPHLKFPPELQPLRTVHSHAEGSGLSEQDAREFG